MKKNNPENLINVVYFGTPEFSAAILSYLIDSSDSPIFSLKNEAQNELNNGFVRVVGVVTNPDKPVGRKQKLVQTPVADVAQHKGIKILKPEKIGDKIFQENLLSVKPDFFIVASYGKIIPQSVLDIPKSGAINVHPSLLPKYRGPSPIITPLLNGDEQTGVTIMLMDDKMDHGPLLASTTLDISHTENNQTLSIKLSQISGPLLLKTIGQYLAGTLTPQPQDHDQATFTKMIKKEDGYFEIDSPPSPKILDRMIRAYYPWPGTWTLWEGKIVKFFPDNIVQMEGKNKVSMKEFLNGYPGFSLKNL